MTSLSTPIKGNAVSEAGPLVSRMPLSGGVAAALALAQREWVRFLRQRHRVFGAVGQPVLFWILFGAGLESTFRLPTAGEAALSYREYFFPGTVVLILLFTSIFATISIIEDRREGFLQSVLVAPAPRWAIAWGKISGAATLAVAQALLFLIPGMWGLGIPWHFTSFVAMLGLLLIISLALTALGFWLAWQMDSTQGFHAVMNVFLMPMWLLSGAFFPAGEGWLGIVIRMNPLTYGVSGMRHLLYWGDADAATWTRLLPSLGLSWLVTLAFAGAMMFLAVRATRKRISGDLL